MHIAEQNQQPSDNQGTTTAEVVTAVALNEQDKAKLAEYLSAYFGGKIAITKTEVDPGLIGGIVIRVGGKLIDGSIRSRLTALRKQLAGSTD
jgi:F-type H+-transporting ATPase subunit delta